MCTREFRQPHMCPGQCACSEKPEKMLGLLQADVCAPTSLLTLGSTAQHKEGLEGLREQFCLFFVFLFLASGIQRNFFQNTAGLKLRNSDLSDHLQEQMQFCSKKVWKVTRLQ